MGRRAKYTFPLRDGRTVGANFKIRGDYFRVQFPHPTEEGKYVEVATGVPVPNNFNPKKDPPADWFTETAKLILKAYSPTLPTDPKTATWETILAEIESESELRPRSLEVYTSALAIFRQFVPHSKGPGDVTPEVAKAFRVKYATTAYTRSPKPDATKRTRSAKTIENAIRRLSGLWRKLMPKYVRENVWEHVSRPTVPKKVPTIPTEEDVTDFFGWLEKRYPGWSLPRLFVEVKAVSGCRLNDLCHVRSDQFNPTTHTLTIRPDQDKTHRERVIPLPADLSAALNQIKGPTYLWERYTEDAKRFRPGARLKPTFTPSILYNAMKAIFGEHRARGGKLKSHGLRKRAITLTALATQNVDQTAQAIGIDATTARKYYLDAQVAFDGSALLQKMAGILRPAPKATPEPKS